MYVGHNLSEDGASDTIMDDGVTLNFRTRIPTTGPLDMLHLDKQAGMVHSLTPKTVMAMLPLMEVKVIL